MKRITMYLACIAIAFASCKKSSNDDEPVKPTEIGNTGVTTNIPIVPPTDSNLPKGSTTTNTDGSTTTTVNTYNPDGTIKAEIAVKVAKDGTKTKVIKEYKYDANKNVTEISTYQAGLTDETVQTPIEKVTYGNYDSNGQYLENSVTKYNAKGEVESSVKNSFRFNSEGKLTKTTKTVTNEGKTNTYELTYSDNGNYVQVQETTNGNNSFWQSVNYDDYGNVTNIVYDNSNSLYGIQQVEFSYTTFPVGKVLVSDENPAGTGKYKVATEKRTKGTTKIEIVYEYDNTGKLVSKTVYTTEGNTTTSEEIKYGY